MARRITVIAERINGTRKKIGEAIANRDAEHIAAEAAKQTAAGAHYIDVNAGVAGRNEAEDLSWLVEVVQGACDLPLCLDSADPAAIAAAIGKTKKPPIVNSVNGDPVRIEGVLPLVAEHGAEVIALTMEEGRMPESVADRMKIAEQLVEEAAALDIATSRMHFDPCVLAASTSQDQARVVLDTVREIRLRWPDTHIVCGLSNISFGMPERALLNRTFTAMMVACGADGFILDPTAPGTSATLAALGVLSGADEFGMGYITAAREGILASNA